MKKILSAVLLLGAAAACDWLADEEGQNAEIRLKFARGEYASTKSSFEIPDTNDFLLDIRSSGGASVYSGAYGASPEAIKVNPGSYTVRVVSEEFKAPAFDKPQFGDEQCIVVAAGGSVSAELLCRQMNSGIKLKIGPSFLESYPDGLLFLKSTAGKVQYAYREKRTAYFNPGAVSLVLDDSGKESVLMTRTMASQEMTVINVSAAEKAEAEAAGGLSIAVDTTRIWSSTDYEIGDSGAGSSLDNAMSVSEAKAGAGATAVWVYGYIVGGDLTSGANGISFTPPFTSRTNLALASRSSASSKSSCISVQLPSGKMRDALNLVDNPDNVGRKLFLKGDIVAAYYGLPGLKNVTDYFLK